MITAYLTSVSTRFNPFARQGRAARSFLALLPANARSTMKIDLKVLPKASQDKPTLALAFKDGRKMDINLEQMKITDIIAEVDRHSRILARKDDLSNG